MIIMPFEIVRNDIVNMKVDAIVNTANPNPVIGSGVDSSIYEKAGSELLKEREKLGQIHFGAAAITDGFNLDAKYVIHTVGPIWIDGNNKEEKTLSSCYQKSLSLAKKYKCKSVAFPLISTGNYGFPKDLALEIAVREISSFILKNDIQVFLVVFDKDSFILSEKLFKSINSFIDEYYVNDLTTSNYHNRNFITRSDLLRYEEDCFSEENLETSKNICLSKSNNCDDLNNMLKDLDASFSETLLKLIDKTGKKDSEIYKKANIDRKLFSKIRTNKNYNPSKSTALAFAFALELDYNETLDFIRRAGFTLSHSNKFDIIVEYFLKNKEYDIFKVNEVLFAFDQPLIGK